MSKRFFARLRDNMAVSAAALGALCWLMLFAVAALTGTAHAAEPPPVLVSCPALDVIAMRVMVAEPYVDADRPMDIAIASLVSSSAIPEDTRNALQVTVRTPVRYGFLPRYGMPKMPPDQPPPVLTCTERGLLIGGDSISNSLVPDGGIQHSPAFYRRSDAYRIELDIVAHRRRLVLEAKWFFRRLDPRKPPVPFKFDEPLPNNVETVRVIDDADIDFLLRGYRR